ncbi:MAG: hypothetical protein AB8G18_02995 [Gammaproteobacteria bacterium]
MSTNKDNPTDADISDLYRTTQNDGPSASLDAAILAQAEAAARPKTKRPAWIAPVGLAATMLLGVNLAMNLKDYSSEPDIFSESQAVSAEKSQQYEELESVEDLVNAAPGPAPEIKSATETELDETRLASDYSQLHRYAGDDDARAIIEARQKQREAAGVSSASTSRKSEEPKQVAERLEAESNSFNTAGKSSKEKYSPERAPVVALVPTPAADSASAIDSSDDRELDQVVVTGSTLPRNARKTRNRTANQAVNTQGALVKSLFSDEQIPESASAPALQAVSNEPYFCDLAALNIDEDSVEVAKVIARSFEPPLNAVSWPGYIRELAQSQDYTTACAQLAAFYELFPNVALVTPLPVALPPEN